MRAQIVAQQHLDNPITFVLPDGTRSRVWLASKEDPEGELWPNGKRYSKIVGDELHWRMIAATMKRSVGTEDHEAPDAPEASCLDARLHLTNSAMKAGLMNGEKLNEKIMLRTSK